MKKAKNRESSWRMLINRMLDQADTDTLRQVYFLLLGYLGDIVSDPDTKKQG